MSSNSLASTPPSQKRKLSPADASAHRRTTVRHESPEHFVVTLKIDDVLHSQIWDAASPLPIGSPFHWVLERVGSAIRIRDISSRPNLLTALNCITITEAEITSEKSFELSKGVHLSVHAMHGLAPVFATPSANEGILRAYACVGNWVLQSADVRDHFVGYSDGQPAFRLVRQGVGYQIESAKTGLTSSTGSGTGSPIDGTATLSAQDLSKLTLRYGTQSWHFDLQPAVALPVTPVSAHSADDTGFLWMLRAAMIGLAAFIAVSWLWPSTKTDELIPAQYAQIVLAPKPVDKKEAPAASRGAASASATSKAVPKSVQKAAVVQAFRAQALQNAVSGLLKGGMTQLMAQSDFVAGRGAVAGAKKILNARSSALHATAPDIGAGRRIAVAAVGGEAHGGNGGGRGVGYGKGEKAGVIGQGRSLVSLDTPAANVQEGLTKDEVGEVIHRHLSEVRYCYESAMIRQPDVEGKLLVSFTIAGTGVVRSAEVKQSTLPDPRLDDCILRRLLTWKFPLSKGGIDVGVTYPFIFKTLGR